MKESALLYAILLILSFKTLAEPYTTIDDLHIESVYAGYTNGIAFFEVTTDIVNSNSCTAKHPVVGIDPNRSDVNQVIALLLYAHATNKKISIQLYDESCISDHSVVRRVKVYD